MKVTIASLFVVLAIAGCYRNSRNEGPAERTGRHIDNAAENTADSAERAAHNARSAVRDTTERLRDND